MGTIHMVDLVSQYKNIENEIQSEMLKVLNTASFINGPSVKDFQTAFEHYLGVKHVIPCANGTDALQIALMSCNLNKGAEILVPSFTYVATVEVIALLGYRPVFVEVYPDTFNINIEDVQDKINDKTAAIIPVHLYGQCSNIKPLIEIAQKHNLMVIEDTAQAIGANYTIEDGNTKKAGTLGNIGTTSFFPSKNLGCFGDGGAIMTNDDDLAKKMRMIANHGQIKKYYHDSIGINSRLDSLQAAVLKIKLKYLDDYCVARQTVADKYDKAFGESSEIAIPKRSSFTSHVFHQYTVKLRHAQKRDLLRDYLASQGIPSMVYYPVPNHLQKAYTDYGYKEGDLPLTEDLCKRVVSFPIHTEMPVEQQDLIIDAIANFFVEQ
ncbi:MAG: DegT/DnrJ/EryC1/StrS family aminotransferase [Cyclobacteriaceae bacterium]